MELARVKTIMPLVFGIPPKEDRNAHGRSWPDDASTGGDPR